MNLTISELTISKEKWICFSIYRPPSTENIKTFFEEMNEVISKALCKYENLIVMVDFNIDIKSSNSDKDKLENFCDLFNITNLVHSETCFMKNSKSIIDLILTNKPLHFQKTHVVETGLSDYHKMISTFFKACLSKLKTEVIYYRRSYKTFNESDFLCSLNKANFDFFKNDPNQNYNLLTDKFLGPANKHAPLKKKFVRGNNAPFMNREFQKEIYVRSRLRKKYWVEPSAENKAAHKKQRNKCVKIRRKSIKRYMDKFSEKGIETNKSFWNFIKPFMTNKGMIANKDITLIDRKNVITDEYELSQIFNKHYINIVEKSCGNKPNKIGTTIASLNDSDVINRIIKTYQNHPSVLKIKNKFGSDLNSFDFQQIKAPEVKKLLKEIDIKKAVGVDTIPPKLIKIGADIIAEPLTQAINCCLRVCVCVCLYPFTVKASSVCKMSETYLRVRINDVEL